MKLAVIQPHLHVYGGVEKVILEIAKNFDVTVYTLTYKPESLYPEFGNLDIRVLKPMWPSALLPSNRIFNALKASWTFYKTELDDYDIINPHGSPAEWIANKNSNVLWYNHGIMREVFDISSFRRKAYKPPTRVAHFVFSNIFKFIEKHMVKNISYTLTNSNYSKTLLWKYLGIEAEVLHPAVDLGHFKPKAHSKYFLVVSRIGYEKRQHYAIEAFKKFIQKTKRKDWKLIIAGGYGDGGKAQEDYFNMLKSIAPKNVQFMLNITEPEKRKLIENCYALLFPSMNEPFGIVPLEAMAAGKVVIVMRDCGGPLDYMQEGKNGFIAPSIEAMADRMNFLVEHRKINEEMGKFARKYVFNNFKTHDFIRAFKKACRLVMGG
ncbi:hypothetical protein DRN74_01785 [Candidatus Micrarchaeota archaeon]|nr:MAG: hypothetical protein DRN74_01785 [Candidatus Micrarchaeota archaeon]